jgi:carbonic anhydrase/acetyltransferase-like protein (isoleucine patch superfamily)/quercetin dioxygenase-like cupin family protein
MPLFTFEGRQPDVSPEAWIAPTAALIGDVRVETGASIWYGAVLRADFGPILVRRGANVQDGSVLHGGDDPVTEVGQGATIGHLCMVHGAVIGTEALVGNGATVLDGARVGSRALVAAGATVPPGMTVPDGMLAAGIPARVIGEVKGRAREWVEENPAAYRDLARRHAASSRPAEPEGPGFGIMQLPDFPDAVAPDGSDVRVLLRLGRGSMAHFELGAGRVSAAVAHRSVEEIWYIVAGHGQMWRRQAGRQETVTLAPGTCVSLPAGTHFQFRATDDGPLAAVGVTMPPWPGEDEAYEVPGPWEANPSG